MDGGGAFGAGKAGGQFDPMGYVKKPSVILRAVCLLFSIVVFGCISSSRGFDDLSCPFNNDENACNFGVTIGVLAFLGLIVFLVLDAIFETHISSIQHRKYIVIADLAFSGVLTFFWFVTFCYLCDTWRKKTPLPADFPDSKPEAAIAFSFFSIAGFGGLTVLAVMKYRKGIAEDFSTPGAYDSGVGGAAAGMPAGGMPGGVEQSPYSAYASGTGETGDPYQQSPFGQQGQGQGQQQGTTGDYNPPTY